METIYIIAMFASTFLHCMGLFYMPLEASTDSFVFVIMATMFMHKLKVKSGHKDSHNTVDKVVECVILCMLMQVFLLGIWFPVHKALQILVDYVCSQHSNILSVRTVDAIRDYTASVGVLAIESAVFLKVFGIDDVQRLYGIKDDLVSNSILSIVAEQEVIVRRREAKMRRK